MSTTLSSMEQQLEDITECPICSDSFIDPRSLPCIHTFCLECLEKYGQGKQKRTKMSCPTCRTEFTIPENGFSGLPKNFFIEKMLQMKKLSSIGNNDACEVCEAKEENVGAQKTAVAMKYCVECHEKLCLSCSKDHLSHKMLRGHQVIDINKTRGPDSAEVFRTTIDTCSKHKDQALNIFCGDCKTPICVVCYISSHKQHDCSDINDVIDKFRKQMTTDVDSMDNGLRKLCTLLGSIERQKQHFVERITTARDEILEKAEKLKQQVESNKKILLGELSAGAQEVSKKLDNLRHEIKQHASFVESLMKYTKELSSKGAVCDIAQEASALHDRVGELLKIDAIEKSRNNMHTIDVQFTGTDALLGISNLIGSVGVQVKPKQALVPTPAGTLTIGNAIVGVTSLADQLFVACNIQPQRIAFGSAPGQQHIKVYETSTYKLQRNIAVPGSQQLYDIVSCAFNNCLYASDWSANNVHRVALSSDYKIRQWAVQPPKYFVIRSIQPAGLSVNAKNNVLVTCSAINSIMEYTTQGSLVRSISLQLTGITCPMFAVQLTNGELVISSDQTLYRVDANGQTQQEACTHVFETLEGRSERISKPGKLVLLRNGCFLVADHNQLVLFNSLSTKGRAILPPLEKPSENLNRVHIACVGEDVRPNKVQWRPASRQEVAIIRVVGFHLDEQSGRLYVDGEFGKQRDHVNPNSAAGLLRVYDNVFPSRDHLT